jgi:protein-tyrosine phosphatase
MGVPGLNLVGAESRGRLEKVTEADTMTTARRQEVLRPSEIKQMELAKFQESCSEIVPDAIYISSYAVASDLDSLKRHRITHILNMAADICENRFPDMFDYSSYYVRDASSEDISVLFYKTLEWMQAAILHGGRVLVHCREGVSRSATMVIAYLMWSFQLPFKEAHDRIRRVRPICNPNPGFTYHLLELGNRLGNGGRHSSAKARVFRVRPHHPKNPFLLLVPVEKPSKPPLFDPRFGWVVQSSQKIVVWLGSQVPDAEAVENFVRQHVRMMESFEKCKFTVTVMQEGKETSLLWQMLELPTAPSGIGAVSLAVYDADYEVMRAAVKARR